MSTVLQPVDCPKTGEPTPEEITHDNKAKAHFLRYCDSGKCIRGDGQSLKANWHEGVCLECAYNPYNMQAAQEDGAANS